MTVTRKTTVQEIGRRTRLPNKEVRLMLDTLIDVWTEELVSGGRIEIEHFLVMEVRTVERAANAQFPQRCYKQIALRASAALRRKLNILNSP